jgi:glutathione peroxidase
MPEGKMRFRRNPLLYILLLSQFVWASANPAAKPRTVYNYSLVGLDGKDVSLSIYQGKVLLIVNLASQSIYKNQISALKELQTAYADKGLVLLGIPSGDFGAEELTDNTSIQHYYQETEHVNFAVFSKASLRGQASIPLVHFLTNPKEGVGGGDIHWSFTKFLVDRQGRAVSRSEADLSPMDPEFRVTIEQLLDGTYKRKDAQPKEGTSPDSEDDDES